MMLPRVPRTQVCIPVHSRHHKLVCIQGCHQDKNVFVAFCCMKTRLSKVVRALPVPLVVLVYTSSSNRKRPLPASKGLGGRTRSLAGSPTCPFQCPTRRKGLAPFRTGDLSTRRLFPYVFRGNSTDHPNLGSVRLDISDRAESIASDS
jgi:hypothetical protein